MNDETFRALVLNSGEDNSIESSITQLPLSSLPDGDVLVEVSHSSLNYKDGLVLGGLGRLVRAYPHVPGVDFVGVVAKSDSARFKPGDAVILTGWRVGETRWGGYATMARVPADFLVPLPAALSPVRAMAIGTAGLTAMLAIRALERAGAISVVQQGRSDVLVTGASGGLGTIAIGLLRARGYQATASTGRATERRAFLEELGAVEVIERGELAAGPDKPLARERWAGVIDTVGGTTLAAALAQVRYGGAIAACGLAGAADYPGSVVPLLLRAVSLIGIDSVACEASERQAAWNDIVVLKAQSWLDDATKVIGLSSVADAAREILKGQVSGRIVVDVNA